MDGAATAILVATITVTNLLMEMFFMSPYKFGYKSLTKDAQGERTEDQADCPDEIGEEFLHGFFPVSA
jgi:hypothetical protein